MPYRKLNYELISLRVARMKQAMHTQRRLGVHKC